MILLVSLLVLVLTASGRGSGEAVGRAGLALLKECGVHMAIVGASVWSTSDMPLRKSLGCDTCSAKRGHGKLAPECRSGG
jgi:hypothetical protein